eukprot:64005-Chlamydomonas_euryale.AAC.1
MPPRAQPLELAAFQHVTGMPCAHPTQSSQIPHLRHTHTLVVRTPHLLPHILNPAHLNTGDTERARAVAERALSTIHYREEQEKFNVWVAWLNMENVYGAPTPEEAVAQLFQVWGRARGEAVA